jgi:hypothetical protein
VTIATAPDPRFRRERLAAAKWIANVAADTAEWIAGEASLMLLPRPAWSFALTAEEPTDM